MKKVAFKREKGRKREKERERERVKRTGLRYFLFGGRVIFQI